MMRRLIIFLFCWFSFSVVFATTMEAYFIDSNRYVERAKKKMAESNYTEAIDALEKALLKTPDDPEIYNLMGDCHKKLKHFSEAAKNYAYAKALSSRKENILADGLVRLSKLF